MDKNHERQIVDTFDIDNGDTIYTVSVGPAQLVDVKVCADDGLVYVMQNEDGSTVYTGNYPAFGTCPGYEYDEAAVVELVRTAHACRARATKGSSLTDKIRKAEESRAPAEEAAPSYNKHPEYPL